MERQKKSNLTSIIFLIIIMLSTSIGLVGVACYSEGYQNWDTYKENIPTIFDENGNGLASGIVHSMPKEIIYTTGAIGDTVTLKATVEPFNATNQKLIWTAEWNTHNGDGNVQDRYIEWIENKNVSTYLGIEAPQKVATLTLDKIFSCPITLTCTSAENSNIKASCQIYCNYKYSLDKLKHEEKGNRPDTYFYKLNNGKEWNEVYFDLNNPEQVNYYYDVFYCYPSKLGGCGGKIFSNQFNFEKLYLHPFFVNYICDNLNVTVSTSEFTDWKHLKHLTFAKRLANEMFGEGFLEDERIINIYKALSIKTPEDYCLIKNISIGSNEYQQVCTAFANAHYSGQNLCAVYAFNESTTTYYARIDADDFQVHVQSLAVDNSTLVF